MISKMRVRAAAKLNLSLDIVGRREDGYHLMDMVMQTISLRDELIIEQSGKSGIELSTNIKYLPTDGRNLVYKAAQLLAERYGVEPSLKIHVSKKIPSQSGMGGGSADAAATLCALNEMWSLSLDNDTLQRLGLELGADVPFMICGGTKRVGGIGEQITDLPMLKKGVFLVAIPPYGNSTRDIFSRYDAENSHFHPDNAVVISALARGRLGDMARGMGNSLFSVASTPVLELLCRKMCENGALSAQMTGSGSAVFGLFSSYTAAKRAFDAMKGDAKKLYITHPVGSCLSVVCTERSERGEFRR